MIRDYWLREQKDNGGKHAAKGCQEDLFVVPDCRVCHHFLLIVFLFIMRSRINMTWNQPLCEKSSSSEYNSCSKKATLEPEARIKNLSYNRPSHQTYACCRLAITEILGLIFGELYCNEREYCDLYTCRTKTLYKSDNQGKVEEQITIDRNF
jgi:hypothetical protein